MTVRVALPKPSFTFHDKRDRNLATILKLPPSTFANEDHHERQLNYLQRYVEELGCESVLIEHHYVDRDYMEEHSVFYSRNLAPLPNFCRRVHFFACTANSARRKLLSTLRVIDDAEAFRAAAKQLSEDIYLGFMVLRPLRGSPIGKTVLRSRPGKGRISSTHIYRAHVLGVPLTIRGLAFQQQDIGVSACATTALWTSLQNAAEYENIAPVSPARVTALASQFTLPFGRSMPSEGLSSAQMSQAIHAAGLSPNLLKVTDGLHARRLLFAVAVSGFAPVLLLRAPAGDENHAVVVSGVDLDINDDFERDAKVKPIVEVSSLVRSLAIHDDRIGPYVPAHLEEPPTSAFLVIDEPTPNDVSLRTRWQLTHLLLPLHSKIRFSFGGLQTAMGRIMDETRKAIRDRSDDIFVEAWIERGHEYTNELLEEVMMEKNDLPVHLFSAFPTARYVALVRLGGVRIGTLDVVFDTTSTERNLVVLAVVQHRDSGPEASRLATALARYLNCPRVKL